MIAKIVTFFILLSAASAATAVPSTEKQKSSDMPLAGVDPNTLSCDPAGQVFLLLPHFTSCNKFYMCAHGEEVEFDCPAPLIFDFELQTCNWAWATECVLRVPKEDIDIEGSGYSEGEIGMFGEEIENGPIDTLTAEASGTVRPLSALALRQFNGILNCNKADAAAKQVPYKGDCQRYWKCVGSVPQSAYCSDGLYFNEETMQCDFEANVKCAVQIEDELKGEFMQVL